MTIGVASEQLWTSRSLIKSLSLAKNSVNLNNPNHRKSGKSQKQDSGVSQLKRGEDKILIGCWSFFRQPSTKR